MVNVAIDNISLRFEKQGSIAGLLLTIVVYQIHKHTNTFPTSPQSNLSVPYMYINILVNILVAPLLWMSIFVIRRISFSNWLPHSPDKGGQVWESLDKSLVFT